MVRALNGSEYFERSSVLRERGIKVSMFDSLDSTNSEARRYAATCVPDESVTHMFIARSQSAGRGRMGRSFFSPAGSGLYLTMLFEVSDMRPEQMLCLTPAAAVAVIRMSEVLGVHGAKIKWINDILVGGKKASGILAESFSFCDKRYAAVGIGINLYTEAFPTELENIATSLLGNGLDISTEQRSYTLLRSAELLSASLYDLKKMIDVDDLSYMDEYRRASAVLGRRVSYVKEGAARFGEAIGVDDLGRLSVREDSGEISVLSGGEISLFLK